MNKPSFAALVFCVFHFFQVFGQAEVNFAEPLIEEFSTDLGSEKGSFEVQYFTALVQNGAFNIFSQKIEMGYVPRKDYGLEVGWANRPTVVADNLHAVGPDCLELAAQFSHVFNQKRAIIAGVELELPFSLSRPDVHATTLEWRPFFRSAAIFCNKFQVQGGLSLEIEQGTKLEFQPRYTASAFRAWQDGLRLGVELNGAAFGAENWLAGSPELAFSTGRLTFHTGYQIPVLNTETTRSGAFLARLSLSFEREPAQPKRHTRH